MDTKLIQKNLHEPIYNRHKYTHVDTKDFKKKIRILKSISPSRKYTYVCKYNVILEIRMIKIVVLKKKLDTKLFQKNSHEPIYNRHKYTYVDTKDFQKKNSNIKKY